MSVNIYDKIEDKLISIAGNTVYADAPIGSIIPFGGSEQACPAGWLICNGNSLSKNDYFNLWKVIGYRFGGSDSTFNLPDLRETVPVGIGENDTQTIEAHDVYTLGQFKDDQLQDHKHTVTPYVQVAAGDFSTAFTYDTPEGSGGSVTVGRHGTTTHGKQLGVNYIIKAKQSAVPVDFMDAVDDAVAEFAPVDTVENGNMKAVTSNAVYDYLTPTEISTTGTTVSQGSATIDFIRCIKSGNTVTIYSQLSEATLTNSSTTTTKLTLPNAVPAAVILTTGAIGYWDDGEVDEACYCHITNGRTLTIFCNIDNSPVSGVHVRFSVTYICK